MARGNQNNLAREPSSAGRKAAARRRHCGRRDTVDGGRNGHSAATHGEHTSARGRSFGGTAAPVTDSKDGRIDADWQGKGHSEADFEAVTAVNDYSSALIAAGTVVDTAADGC